MLSFGVNMIKLIVVICIISCYIIVCSGQAVTSTTDARYFNVPLHEIAKREVYLAASEHGEIKVTYSDKGSDFKANDYVTHADGLRLLSGSLTDFLKSGERETVVPVVDDSDEKYGGHRLIGFVMIQPITPRKLVGRRGEIKYDFDEGGPPPTFFLNDIFLEEEGLKLGRDLVYEPPPHGGGRCITSRDCYDFNGTCVTGQCRCTKKPYTGTYCQLYRPESEAIEDLAKKAASRNSKIFNKEKEERLRELLRRENGYESEDKKDTKLNFLKSDSLYDPNESKFDTEFIDSINDNKAKNPRFDSERLKDSLRGANIVPEGRKEQKNENDIPMTSNQIKESKSNTLDNVNANTAMNNNENDHNKVNDGEHTQGNENNDEQTNKTKPKMKMKPGAKKRKPMPKDDQSESSEDSHSMESTTIAENQKIYNEQQRQHSDKQISMEDLYGPDKVYPEPYLAGKLPRQLIHERQKNRISQFSFTYSVRYRSGPLGISFDNKVSDATIVEKVVVGQQSEQSDVKSGDYLIAIDTFNVSTSPAKVSLRILGSLPWPKVLVFHSKGNSMDVFQEAESARKRSFNISVIYPPTLVQEISAKVASWTPGVNLAVLDHCPLYVMKTPKDSFGCSVEPDEYLLPDLITRFHNAIHNNTQSLSLLDESLLNEMESKYPMLSFIIRESKREHISYQIKFMPIVKRGVCNFVEKARKMHERRADFGVMVNSDNELIELPNGKENTTNCKTPLAVTKESDMNLIHLSGFSNEILAVISDPIIGYTSDCIRLQSLVEEIIDKWSHSVPKMSLKDILSSSPPNKDKMRSLTDEGGRIAVSGENGWAFFDYHLAMFGPQEVPLGPMRIQMAYPPFGCDPSAYTVRIKDTMVAILRGGGCSFGIKVINAQKLGAKSVMIVNTDDSKTMRLMALPDEIPLIKIPCIMVSRRIQFYLEQQLRPFYHIDQHLVSIQPMVYNGEYEKRNTVPLPKRVENIK